MNRRDFIGGCAAGAAAARFGDDILESEAKRLAKGQSDVEITMNRGIEPNTYWVDEDLPQGIGPKEYDHFSPLLLNFDAS